MVTWLLFAVWIVLSIATACFFWGSREAHLKRTVYPWVVWGFGALFVLIAAGGSGTFWILVFVVPGVLFFGGMNLALVKFCDSCGATLSYYNFKCSGGRRICPHCGTPVDLREYQHAENDARTTKGISL